VSVWRNQWLHTGDEFTRDADGNFYFVDRIDTAIRGRGENISSFEVESEVNNHSDVLESAAVAVPSEFGEDEVKIVVVPQAARSMDPTELIDFLSGRMTRFMVPRYVEIVGELPKTPDAEGPQDRVARRERGAGNLGPRDRWSTRMSAQRARPMRSRACASC